LTVYFAIYKMLSATTACIPALLNKGCTMASAFEATKGVGDSDMQQR
jgi:hypothetical protein